MQQISNKIVNNSLESFKNVDFWLKELKFQANPDIKIFIIGNKTDLLNRKVTEEEAKAFAEENKLNLFMESSAKTGFNAQKVKIVIR